MLDFLYKEIMHIEGVEFIETTSAITVYYNDLKIFVIDSEFDRMGYALMENIEQLPKDLRHIFNGICKREIYL